jgi:hypothetical protein
MPAEESPVTVPFKVDLVNEAVISKMFRLFSEYRKIMGSFMEYVH